MDDEIITIDEREPSAQPVGHDGSRILITEKQAWHLKSGVTFPLFLLLILLSGLAIAGLVWGGVAADNGSATSFHIIALVLSIAIIATTAFLFTGFTIVSPGHTKVVQFFGKYIGTLRNPGFVFTTPLSSRRKVSARVRNFETNEAKVNEYNGNPIKIAAIIVWQVADTAKATFAVEDYEKFVQTQAESALRHVATQHPYDNPVDGRISLRGSTDEVSEELAREVADRVLTAGIEILETRISSLSYAPEIAQAMLQRQQAAAIVDARETIVDGAVSMVQQALDQLEERDIVVLDPERRASMVSNLLVVLCSDGQTQPVINTGSIYS
ncbi:regulator of protease activity HflC (stomatin/prohibitin superfamily) [Arcanobacterium pluranimalium]|uniref:SPFH domain-containing protein n=1 Tax=Arcanobacterium pluranimalium TaxID=108028 RepID=UPI001959B1F6|nr:SPFH domain-containing protein [Arcanobacterium pluranimalium]MBM7824798.1 regulator of protease activity HflC (stomatin/prohibitin superfamily) [Arcanobacterium pluranimalium]